MAEETDRKATPRPRPNVEALVPYRATRPSARTVLDANEAPRTSERVRSRLLERIAGLDLNRYPRRDRGRELAEQIARLYVPDSEGRGVSVVLGNGSNEVIQAIYLAFGGPGRKAVYFEPTYTVYGAVAHLTDTEAVPLARDAAFRIGEEAFEEAVCLEPSIVHLCTPNNPTGNEDDTALVGRLAEALPGAVVVVDRAYGPFGGSPEERRFLEHDNVVVLKTFSKAAGLAGLRIGVGVAVAEVAEALSKCFLPYNLDAVSLEAVAVCLEEIDAIRAEEEALAAQRRVIYQAVCSLPSLTAFASAANFVLFGPRGAGRALPDTTPAEAARLTDLARSIWDALLEESVLVRDCTRWPGLVGCLRVSAGTPEETAHFVSALEKAVARIEPSA